MPIHSTLRGRSFPAEAIRMIVQHLIGTKWCTKTQEPPEAIQKNLQACMLISRDWVHICRDLLYRVLNMSPRTVLTEYAAMYTQDRLAPYVTLIHLTSHSDDKQASWLDPAVPFLSRFTRVDSLMCHQLDWGTVHIAARQSLIIQLSSLKVLHLQDMVFDGSAQLLSMLNAFPRLADLHLTDVVWRVTNHLPHQIASTNPLVLDNLYLEIDQDCPAHRLLPQWLVGQRDDLQVEDVQIFWVDIEMESLIRFLRKIAQSVDRLILEFKDNGLWQINEDKMVEDSDEAATPSEWKLLQDEVAICTAAIQLQPFHGCSARHVDIVVHWTPMAMLQLKIASQLVTEDTPFFRIDLVINDPKDLTAVPWHEVDALLASIPPPLPSEEDEPVARLFTVSLRWNGTPESNQVDRVLFDTLANSLFPRVSAGNVYTMRYEGWKLEGWPGDIESDGEDEQ
ncbi:hypothetical protein B0H21DRAFT_708418 [Amylocystis lapponica]|nr:hypothetical protein B0H21DRAFT_708418 [Amylocystis lapponica]